MSCAFTSLRSLLYYSSPGVGCRVEAENIAELFPSSNFASEMYALYFKTRVSKSQLTDPRLTEPTGLSAEQDAGGKHGQEFRGQVGSWACRTWSHFMGCGYISQLLKGLSSRLPGHHNCKTDFSWLHICVARQLKHQANYQDSLYHLTAYPVRRNARL